MLSESKIVSLETKYSHYLKNVLRLKIKDQLRIFNGIDGEFIATIIDITKNTISIELNNLIKKPFIIRTLTLGLCIIKIDRMLDAINMAVQLGVTQIVPLISERSQLRTMNNDRILKCIIEATQQSERLNLPAIDQITLLKDYNKKIKGVIIYANENEVESNSLMNKINSLNNDDISLIVGPEGGFSDEEFYMFSSWTNAFSISLGPNILRTETAVATGLAQIMLVRNINA